jgi:hypothetical protein
MGKGEVVPLEATLYGRNAGFGAQCYTARAKNQLKNWKYR